MKKVKRVTFQGDLKTENLERFKPLYLLSTASLEQSKQILIFISSDEKNCYIQEKGNWQELIIDDLLLSQKSKTYCFSVKNVYRYLNIPYQDQAYLTLAKNSKHKISLSNLELSEEIFQELGLPNLKQLDTSGIAKTKLEAEKILALEVLMAASRVNIKAIEAAVAFLLELKGSLEKLGRRREEPITLVNINAQVELFSQKITIYRSEIQNNQAKIQKLITKESYLKSECYKEKMPELIVQKKDLNRKIQKIEEVIDKLKKTAECFKNLNTSLEGSVIGKKEIDQQLQLLEKEKLSNELQYLAVEEKIKDLEKEESRVDQNSLVTSQVKQLFFDSPGQTYPVADLETELKNFQP